MAALWSGATGLVRAVAAGLILLFALALSSTSAFACNERQELLAGTRAGLVQPFRLLPGVVLGTGDILSAGDLAQPDTRDDADDSCPGGPGHCPCSGPHCGCAGGSLLLHCSSGLAAPLAADPPWMVPPAARDGLRRAPDDRPPRLI